jgi:hypothetical protein
MRPFLSGLTIQHADEIREMDDHFATGTGWSGTVDKDTTEALALTPPRVIEEG